MKFVQEYSSKIYFINTKKDRSEKLGYFKKDMKSARNGQSFSSTISYLEERKATVSGTHNLLWTSMGRNLGGILSF